MRLFLVCWAVLVTGLSACGGRPAEVAPPVQPAPVKSVEHPDAALIAAVNEKNSVFFATSSAVVDADGLQKLQAHALQIKANPKWVVGLLGYTDDLGSRAYNLAIAEQRVNAVYGVLRRAGVPIRQLRRNGGASDIGSKTCESIECRAKMRRVELVYPTP